jgi:hypothetical protein
MTTAIIVAGILLAVLGAGLWLKLRFDALFEPSWDEVARRTSPSGKLDAVLFEVNGGATTSFAYQVYIVKKNEKVARTAPTVASAYAASRSPCAYGLNLRWRGERKLDVEYLSAQFENTTSPVKVEGSEPVQIELRSGIVDASAPSGGMLWNAIGRPGDLHIVCPQE